jgi:hypothetical protein
MVSAYLNTRERVGHAVAAFPGEPDPRGPGLAGCLGAAGQSCAGWVPLRGWVCWVCWGRR